MATPLIGSHVSRLRDRYSVGRHKPSCLHSFPDACRDSHVTLPPPSRNAELTMDKCMMRWAVFVETFDREESGFSCAYPGLRALFAQIIWIIKYCHRLSRQTREMLRLRWFSWLTNAKPTWPQHLVFAGYCVKPVYLDDWKTHSGLFARPIINVQHC